MKYVLFSLLFIVERKAILADDIVEPDWFASYIWEGISSMAEPLYSTMRTESLLGEKLKLANMSTGSNHLEKLPGSDRLTGRWNGKALPFASVLFDCQTGDW